MKEIIEKLIKFRDDRNWQEFHTKERLATSTHIEAGELAQLFQWGKAPVAERVAEEVADVGIYLIYLCETYGFDLRDIILKKIKKNGTKYPVGVDTRHYGWDAGSEQPHEEKCEHYIFYTKKDKDGVITAGMRTFYYIWNREKVANGKRMSGEYLDVKTGRFHEDPSLELDMSKSFGRYPCGTTSGGEIYLPIHPFLSTQDDFESINVADAPSGKISGTSHLVSCTYLENVFPNKKGIIRAIKESINR